MTTASKTIDILFFGDIVGKPGRAVVQYYLTNVVDKPDIVIANSENTSHGFGLLQKHYQELRESGIHILTGGNHTWDQKEILHYIDHVDAIVRPHNMPGKDTPGVGRKVFTINTPRHGPVKVGVINLIGQVYMGSYNSPWDDLEALVTEMKAQTPVVFLDLHAEATAEKKAMGWYVASLGVSAMVGTHTHVQTADDQILSGTTGYVTDAGFNGSFHSVIGMSLEQSLRRLMNQMPARMEVGPTELAQVNAVRFTIELETGLCRKVRRVNEVYSLVGGQAQLVS